MLIALNSYEFNLELIKKLAPATDLSVKNNKGLTALDIIESKKSPKAVPISELLKSLALASREDKELRELIPMPEPLPDRQRKPSIDDLPRKRATGL